MNDEQSLVQQLGAPLYSGRGWIRFVGILEIIGGIVTAIGAALQLARGANASLGIARLIFACLFVWLGTLLLQCATSIGRAVNAGDRAAFLLSQNKLRLYFLMQGVVIIVAVVLGIIAGFAGAMAMNHGSPAF